MSKAIFMNKKGDLFIFWATKKKAFVETEHGACFTESRDAFMCQLINEIERGELIYVCEL